MVLVITFIHSLRIHFISYFQRFFTFLKVILILVLIVCGFWLAEASNVSFEPTMKAFDSLLSLPFAVALVFVMYSYSGWNASVYIVGEIKKPGKNLPRSLFIGTAMVMVLYILLNSVFLYSTPISEMQGQEEVGYIAARHIFGEQGGMIMGLLISIGLISAISAMIWAGPRVSMVIGEDMSIFRFFVRKNRNGIPIVGLWIQCIVVLILTLTFSFENIVIYTGLILTFFSFLTVLGVIILRIKQPGLERPYKTWGYPYTTIFFLIVTGWMMFFLIKERVEHSVAVVLTIAAGIILFFINRMIEKSKRRPEN